MKTAPGLHENNTSDATSTTVEHQLSAPSLTTMMMPHHHDLNHGHHSHKSPIKSKPRIQVLSPSTSVTGAYGTSSLSSSSSSSSSNIKSVSRTLVLRVMFVMSIVMAVIVCSVVSYLKIQDLELEVGRQTYESITSSALQSAQAITVRKLQGAKVVASVLSFTFPDYAVWPFVGLDGYYHAAREVASLAQSGPMAMSVLVQPGEQAKAFEVHAQRHFANQGYPDNAGLSDFGFGIWRNDPEHSPYKDGRVHSTTGNETVYGSPHTVLTPMLDHTMWNTKALMYDVHTTDTAADALIECSQKAAIAATDVFLPETVTEEESSASINGPQNAPEKPPCTISTGFFKLFSRPDLATLIYHPIYPANNPTDLVGFIGTSIQWVDVLTDLVPDYMDKIYAVISADSELHSNTGFNTATFVIENGKPRFLGQGDLHDPQYQEYARSIVLNDVITQATTSVKHQLTIYPASFNQFATKSPMAVSLGFAAVIAICTVIFIAYDFLMRRDINERKIILEVKRRFVRFISHEIRTPLNTVCMGLELLESELQSHKSKNTKPDAEDQQLQQRQDNTSSAETNVDYWYDITHDIQENAASAVTILNELLKYDKIETGNLELDIGQVMIWDLVTKVTSQFKLQAVKKGIEMTFSVQADGIEPDLESGEGSIHDALRALVVLGDDMRLQEVIRNVISNALKFTPPGGKIDISVSRVPDGLPSKKRRPSAGQQMSDQASFSSMASFNSFPRAGSIMISVVDSGVGMSEQQLTRVFQEGVQFNPNKLQAGGGSGLGLCISKGIIQRHHGTIVARSRGQGKGCTFLIELPLYNSSDGQIQSENIAPSEVPLEMCIAQPSTPDPVESSSMPHIPDVNSKARNEDNDLVERPPKQSEPEGVSAATPVDTEAAEAKPPPPLDPVLPGKHHVLVVDDVMSNRKMLVRLLERAGHICLSAGDGQEAIDIMMANREAISAGEGADAVFIDCVLMDYEMPVKNGPDATWELRQLGYEGTVLGVTGNVLKEDVDFFIQKGADDVLPKPVSMELLNNYWKRHASP